MSGYSFVLFLHVLSEIGLLVLLCRGQFLLAFGRLALLTYRETWPFVHVW